MESQAGNISGADKGPFEKPCSKCGQVKPLDEFYSNGRGRPAARCKPCFKADVARRRREQFAALGGLDWVYTVYDAEGTCLYVGRTNRPEHRMGNHKLKAQWWDRAARAARVEWQQFLDLEAQRIRDLRPEFNEKRAA